MHALARMMSAFWSVYYALITFTNVADLVADRCGASWAVRFRSNNLLEVRTAVATVSWSKACAGYLFIAVIAAEAIGCALFAAASVLQPRDAAPAAVVWAALCWGALVWQAFLLADSVFRTYQFTVVHAVLLCATLLTALVFQAGGQV